MHVNISVIIKGMFQNFTYSIAQLLENRLTNLLPYLINRAYLNYYMPMTYRNKKR